MQFFLEIVGTGDFFRADPARGRNPGPEPWTDQNGKGRGAMQEIGSTVKVRGVPYRIVARRPAGALGSKFYGRYTFTLVDADGKRFEVFCKSVAHNSRIREVSE